MHRVLKPRPGMTLVEIMVALVLTAVIGASVTSVFITQSRFFDTQEKAGFARGVSRSAMNIIISELRMLEQADSVSGGIIAATNKRIQVRAPYAIGMVCSVTGGLTIARLPADPSVLTDADSSFAGFAFRRRSGSYTYVEGGPKPAAGNASNCAANNVAVVTDGGGAFNGTVVRFTSIPNPAPLLGAPVFFYQIVTYEFKSSIAVPGRIGLFRTIATGVGSPTEELLAPFDTTAKFRFFVNDSTKARTAVPAALNTITGLELTLDGQSERPGAGGKFQRVPLTTSVFFKNRPR